MLTPFLLGYIKIVNGSPTCQGIIPHLTAVLPVQGSPDLIVEILSPSTANTDRDQKFKIYQEPKVSHYWIIDPTAQTLEEYVWQPNGYSRWALHTNDDEFHPSLFPELMIPLEELWS